MDDTPTQTEETVVSTAKDEANDVNVLLSLEEMIKNTIASLDKMQDELKIQREMVNNTLANDTTYGEHEQKAKEAAKVKTKTKQEILKRPAVLALSQKVKDISSELNDKRRSLSEYLYEYHRMTGATQIETLDGEMRQIVSTLKLVKPAPKKGKKK